MSLTSKIAERYRQHGIRGVTSAVLRNAADILDYRQLKWQAAKQENEYLKWIQFAVPGMLNPGNIQAMNYAIANLPHGKPVIEIGSFCGLSTAVIAHFLERHGCNNHLFTCDRWEFEGQKLGSPLGDSKSVTHDLYRDYVKETFLRTMQTFSRERLPFTIERFSDEFFQSWFAFETVTDVFGRAAILGGEIGFCYIDGNHTYECALRDFENSDRALVAGGFILFDDSADGTAWEVNRLVKEIAKLERYELVSQQPNYLFRRRDGK